VPELLELILSEKGPDRTRRIVGARPDLDRLCEALRPLSQDQLSHLFDLLEERFPFVKFPSDPIPMTDVLTAVEEMTACPPTVFDVDAAKQCFAEQQERIRQGARRTDGNIATQTGP
jgi:hypothetical protein